MTEIVLRHAENTAEITACFPVMVLLRPHLANAEEFAARVARQYAAGYRLLAAWTMIGSEAGEVMAAVQTTPWRLRSPQARAPIGTPKF
jgi:hypothetical protein